MNLRVVTETKTTITLGWDPVPAAAEYRGTRKNWVKTDGSQRWAQTAALQMKFSKDEWYVVEALAVVDSGKYAASPTRVFPSSGVYPSDVSP